MEKYLKAIKEMEPGRICECSTSGIRGHGMAQVVHHWPHQGGPVPMGFVVDTVTLGHVFSKYFSFPRYHSINVQYVPFATVRAVESCRYQ